MKVSKDKRFWTVVAVLVIALLSVSLFFYYQSNNEQTVDEEVASFQECVDAGYSVMESYPRRCVDAFGEVFVEEIDEDFVDEEEEYYGSSTNYPCESDEDCLISGCNSEICQGADEETMASICIFPEEPLPQDLGYSCGCFDGQCQWGQ